MKTALSERVASTVHPPGATNNSWLGLWIGIGYALLCLSCWIPLDLWLHATGRPYITTCVRRLLESGSWWAVLGVGSIGFVTFIAGYHFFYERTL